MVHKHSPAAIALRRQRALSRGFIRCWTEACTHYDGIGDKCLKGDNLDKSIDPFTLVDPWACSAPVRGEDRKSLCSNESDIAVAWKHYRPPSPPPESLLRAGADEFDPLMNPCPNLVGNELDPKDGLIAAQNDAIALVMRTLELHLYYSSGFDPGDLLHRCNAMQQQIKTLDAQIRELAASLPGVVESSIAKRLPIAIDELRSKSSEGSAETVQGNILHAIEAAVDKSIELRLPRLHDASDSAAVKLSLEKRFYELFRPHVDELILPLVQEVVAERIANASEATSNTCVKHMSGLLKQYDTLVQRQFGDTNDLLNGVSSRVDDLESMVHSTSSCRSLHPASLPTPPSSRDCVADTVKEMTTNEFIAVAADVRKRLPHLPEVARPLLMIADAQFSDHCDARSEATSELLTDDERQCLKSRDPACSSSCSQALRKDAKGVIDCTRVENTLTSVAQCSQLNVFHESTFARAALDTNSLIHSARVEEALPLVAKGCTVNDTQDSALEREFASSFEHASTSLEADH